MSLDTGRGRRCLSIRVIMEKTTTTTNFLLREALPGWHSRCVQQENLIAQLNWRGGRGKKRIKRQQSLVKKIYAHCSLTSFGKCSSLGHLQADCLPLDILAALSFVFPIYLVVHILKHCYQQDFTCKHTKILLVDIL